MASTSLPIGYRYATPLELLAAGKSLTSRQVVTPDGDFISRRQAEKLDAQQRGFTSKEEQRAAAKASAPTGGISSEVQSIRESYRKQAEQYGLDTRIRGNANYQMFKQERQDLEKTYDDLVKSLGKQQGNLEYRRQRLDIYLKFGLISQDDYDRYMGVQRYASSKEDRRVAAHETRAARTE